MKNEFLKDTTLVFDLDGTLVDTAPDLYRTLNHVLGEAGYPAVDSEYIRPVISFGARRMIVEGLTVGDVTLGEEEIDRLFEKFLAYYAANIAIDSRPYPNLIPVLETAAASGATLAVCTNKREDMSLALLKELDLDHRFAAIIGRDTLDVCKPHPRHLTETIARASGSTDRAIMIGDSPTDVATAKAAEIPVVAVSFGYSEVPPAELGANALIDDYNELMDVLPGLLTERAT